MTVLKRHSQSVDELSAKRSEPASHAVNVERNGLASPPEKESAEPASSGPVEEKESAMARLTRVLAAVRIDSLVVVAVGLWLVFEMRSLPPSASTEALSPSLYPTLIGYGLIVLGALLFFSSFRDGRRARTVTGPQAPDASAVEAPIKIPWLRTRQFGIVLLLFIYAFMMPYIGYVVSTVLLMGCILLVMDYSFLRIANRRVLVRRVVGRALLCVVVPILITLLFSNLLGVTLPLGPLGGLLP